MYKILTVEDQTILRETLENNLRSTQKYKILPGISDARKAADACLKSEPDLILMDIWTDSNANGIDATKEIKETFPDVKVVIMTGIMEDNYIQAAKRAGADSFVYKNVQLDQLINVIDSTLAGYHIFPDVHKAAASALSFSNRETEVLRYLSKGDSIDTIARELYVAPSTVRTYTKRLMDKTKCDSIAKLIVYAITHGYV